MGKKILNSKVFYAAISILLAFVLWLYVGREANPEVTNTLSRVQVVFSGLESLEERGLMISEGEEQTVSLRIRASRDVWRRLNQGDTTITIDVSGITEPGEQSVSVTTRNISFPRSITALDSIDVQYTSPGTVEFTVSRWVSKEVPVEGTFNGSVADGYQRENFTFAPETVTISGREELVNQVESALVTVSQQEMNATFMENCGYTLVDADGKPVADAGELETSPETVLVTLPIVQLKEVELTVDIIAGGGATEDNVTVSIEPSTITVSGEAADLAELDSISLGRVDLSEVFGTQTQKMPITLDASLTNVSGPAEATVTVTVEGLYTRTLEVDNIDLINKPDGYQAELVTQSLTVLIRGPQEALDSVTASQIRVVADLSDLDLSTGTRTVPVRVYLNGNSEVGVVGDYNISISVTRE